MPGWDVWRGVDEDYAAGSAECGHVYSAALFESGDFGCDAAPYFYFGGWFANAGGAIVPSGYFRGAVRTGHLKEDRSDFRGLEEGYGELRAGGSVFCGETCGDDFDA